MSLSKLSSQKVENLLQELPLGSKATVTINYDHSSDGLYEETNIHVEIPGKHLADSAPVKAKKTPKPVPKGFFRARDEPFFMRGITSRTCSTTAVTDESTVEIPSKDGSFIARRVEEDEEYNYSRLYPTFKARDAPTYQRGLTSRSCSATSLARSIGAPSATDSFVGRKMNHETEVDYSHLYPLDAARRQPFYESVTPCKKYYVDAIWDAVEQCNSNKKM